MTKILAESTCHIERWHRAYWGSEFTTLIRIRPCWHHLLFENFFCIGLLFKEEPLTVSLRNVLWASRIRPEAQMITNRDLVVEDAMHLLVSAAASALLMLLLLFSIRVLSVFSWWPSMPWYLEDVIWYEIKVHQWLWIKLGPSNKIQRTIVLSNRQNRNQVFSYRSKHSQEFRKNYSYSNL